MPKKASFAGEYVCEDGQLENFVPVISRGSAIGARIPNMQKMATET